MPTAFRLVRAPRSDDAFSGEGARIWGGRWNSPGRPVVYVADSLALAALETLVHILPRRELAFVSFQLEIPAHSILAAETLPPDWKNQPPPPAATAVGDEWLAAGRSLALRVPSAIVGSASNYLLNPRHAHFGEIEVGPPEPFTFDRRLFNSDL